MFNKEIVSKEIITLTINFSKAHNVLFNPLLDHAFDINVSSLDRLHNHSLGLITGQLVSTPLEALQLEAAVQSYSTYSKRLILKANEKARRSTNDHPKRIALDVKIHSAFKVAQVSVEKQKNSRLSCHLIFNTDKTSFIFLLHHGSKAPLIPDESPPLSQVLPVELMTTT